MIIKDCVHWKDVTMMEQFRKVAEEFEEVRDEIISDNLDKLEAETCHLIQASAGLFKKIQEKKEKLGYYVYNINEYWNEVHNPSEELRGHIDVDIKRR